MDIEVVPINNDQEFKLRIDGTLYGVFWTDAEARQYAKDHLPFNWDNDLSNRPPVLKSVPATNKTSRQLSGGPNCSGRQPPHHHVSNNNGLFGRLRTE